MTGDKGPRRLVKFWWVFFATVGAAGGATAVTLFGIFSAIWGILGVGLPLGVAIGIIEWRADRRVTVHRPEIKQQRHSPPPRTHGFKHPAGRGQLHAISREKTVEPPSSGGTSGGT